MLLSKSNYQEDIYVKISFFLDGEGSWSSLEPVGVFILPFPKGRVYSDKLGIKLLCCFLGKNK